MTPFDSSSHADEAAARFTLALRPDQRGGSPPGSASQVALPTVGSQWLDVDEIRAASVARNGSDGNLCQGCNRWRWLPVPVKPFPPFRMKTFLGANDIAPSPEWFGDGWNSLPQVLVRRELAELLAEASHRDFDLAEVHDGSSQRRTGEGSSTYWY